ncbi:MAG: hypothetical protein M3R15_25255 [Acidobacteriota bacterium]|nr:hypothetical protein [Acidobacteriota bacterium]
MTKQTYDERLITRYLLGSLTEGETVRLDELSFSDDEFADALEAAEKDLVDAYARGELSGQMLERFKSFYLASPLRREKVSFAQAFQGFAEKAATPQLAASQEAASESRKAVSWLPFSLNLLKVPSPAWGWGLAAAVLVLLLAGGWLVFENYRLREHANQADARGVELRQREQELQTQLAGERSASAEAEKERARDEMARIEQEQERQRAAEGERAAEQQRVARQSPSLPREVSIASFVLLPQTRGIGQIAAVSIPTRIDYVAMQLELESEDYPLYRVALRDQAHNRIIWRSGNLKAKTKGESKTLAVRLRARLLQPQVYVLEVSGVPRSGAAEIVGGYPFRVIKQ